jgi:hypothetical protein
LRGRAVVIGRTTTDAGMIQQRIELLRRDAARVDAKLVSSDLVR